MKKWNGELSQEKQLYAYIEQYANGHCMEQTKAALPFAWEKHKNQMRQGTKKIPYIVHPLSVARHGLALGLDQDEMVAAALLHDVCEDCGFAPEALPVNQKVQKIVADLTFTIPKGCSKAEAKAQYFKIMEENEAAMMIKLLDRCNNVSTMGQAFSKERLRRYIEETRRYILPMIEILWERTPWQRDTLFLLNYQICSLLDTVQALWQIEERHHEQRSDKGEYQSRADSF